MNVSDYIGEPEQLNNTSIGVLIPHNEINHDPVNNPEHYTCGSIECWDEMVLAFGPQVVYNFCICNAWKYRYRAPFKGHLEQDYEKANVYMKKAKELKEKYNL